MWFGLYSNDARCLHSMRDYSVVNLFTLVVSVVISVLKSLDLCEEKLHKCFSEHLLSEHESLLNGIQLEPAILLDMVCNMFVYQAPHCLHLSLPELLKLYTTKYLGLNHAATFFW